MKSLFLRIFLSFWMAQALFVVLAILVTLAFRPRSSTWEGLRTTVLNEAVSAYEEGNETQLRQYMENMEATQHVRAYLFDERGNELSGRGAPDWAMRVAAGGTARARGMDSLFRRLRCSGIRALRPMASTATRWCWDCRRGREYFLVRADCRSRD